MGKKAAGIVMAIVMLVGLFAHTALAGGIDNKQNWSTQYIATGSRNAALDGVDIAAYNPAGIMFQQDGIGLGVDVHYIFKDYEQTYTKFPQMTSVTRDQDEPSIIPGLFATYKTGPWGVFGSITNNGGGGMVKYESGNTITNDIGALLFFDPRPGINGTLLSNEMIKAESHYITYTVGGAYRFNEMFSMAAGFRYVDATKEVEAFADTTSPLGAVYGSYDEDADGWGWIASLNFQPRKDLLFALRYESRVELEFETTINGVSPLGAGVLGALGKTQGAKSDRDLPAVLGLGAAWDVTDRLNLNTSFTYYFEEDADWDGQEDLVSNSWDLAFSATYRFLDNLRGSIGYMYTYVDMDAKDFGLTEKMSPVLDAHSLFCGLGYDFNPMITLNLGLMTNFYDDKDAPDALGNPVNYDKANTALAMGVALRF
jgi:long-chain fatty acid transport protein